MRRILLVNDGLKDSSTPPDGFSFLGLTDKSVSTVNETGSKSSNIIETTYSKLVEIINKNSLVAGAYYLITDFQSCYDQPDFDYNGTALTGTYKQGPIEPLLVFAISSNQLSNEAKSLDYPKDKIKYDVTFNLTESTSGAALGRITERIDDTGNRTDYDHRNIEFKRYDTYKIDHITGFVVKLDDKLTPATVTGKFTQFTEELGVNDVVYFANINEFYKVTEIIDDFTIKVEGHDYLPFDFTGDSNPGVNIFKGTLFEGGSYKRSNVIDNTNYIEVKTFENTQDAFNNYIGDFSAYKDKGGYPFLLSNNVFGNPNINPECYDNQIGDNSYNNTFNSYFLLNKFKDFTSENVMISEVNNNEVSSNFYSIYALREKSEFVRNKIANGFNYNIILQSFYDNEIGNNFQENIIVSQFNNNEIGNNFIGNYLCGKIDSSGKGSVSFRGNKIANSFSSNIIYLNFYDNFIQNNFGDNEIYCNLYDNKIGEDFIENLISNTDLFEVGQFYRNNIGNSMRSNNFIGAYFQNNNIGNNFQYNTIRETFYKNEIGNGFNNNSTSFEFFGNDIGNAFNNNDVFFNFYENVISDRFSNNFKNTSPSSGVAVGNWGHDTLQDLTTRDYTNFQDSLSGNIGYRVVGLQMIMHDTVNDTYWKIVFTKWQSGGYGGEFEYTRTLIDAETGTEGESVTFHKEPYSNDVDIIVPGVLEITRGNNGGIYNSALEANYTSITSPQGTEWNSRFNASEYTGSYFYNNEIGFGFENNQIGTDFQSNKIGNAFYSNKIRNYYNNNFVGNQFYENTISFNFSFNRISNFFYLNNILNDFGYGGGNSRGNDIGNYFYENNIGEYFYDNRICDQFYSNEVGNNFQFNRINAHINGVDFNKNYGLIDTFGTNIGKVTIRGVDGTYNVSASGGSGEGAVFTVTVSGGVVSLVELNSPGNKYIKSDTLTISDSLLGGTDGNSIVIDISSVSKDPLVYSVVSCDIVRNSDNEFKAYYLGATGIGFCDIDAAI